MVFIRGDDKQAQYEKKIAEEAQKMREERERRLKLDNAKRKIISARLNAERKEKEKNALLQDIRALEDRVAKIEKETSLGTLASVSPSSGRALDIERNVRNARMKVGVAAQVKKMEGEIARLEEDLKRKKRELEGASGKAREAQTELKRWEEEKTKASGARKQTDDKVKNLKAESGRLKINILQKKNLVPAVEREYEKAAAEARSLEEEIRSLEK
ncbi:MAG: hypothetical protein AAB805_01360 [Patescibacteria group bacterium]